MNSFKALPVTEPHEQAHGALEIRVVTSAEDVERFNALCQEHHYLGATRAVGDFLRQVAILDGQWVGLLAWGSAAYKLQDREEWIGWNNTQRAERLKLVAQNRRYLLLGPKGAHPNRASQVLAAATRALPLQWEEHFGYRVLVAESFTDPEQFAGTCYKASNWEPVGFSEGNTRHRADFYVPNERPKRLWLKELVPGGRKTLGALKLPQSAAGALVAAPSGTLPLSLPQVSSLFEVFRLMADPRTRGAQFRIGGVLTLTAMAVLCGACDVSQVARFATRLRPRQRAHIGMPRKAGTEAFYRVPSYSVFYQVLKRMDAEEFARRLCAWLQAAAGTLPAALALDGKMIRDQIGLITLAEHEDGSPYAMALMDQKEGTERCELSAAQELLETLPALDGKTITGDALHCQKETARIIVEKGGDYLLQLKANQPTLLGLAEKLEKVTPPFFRK